MYTSVCDIPVCTFRAAVVSAPHAGTVRICVALPCSVTCLGVHTCVCTYLCASLFPCSCTQCSRRGHCLLLCSTSTSIVRASTSLAVSDPLRTCVRHCQSLRQVFPTIVTLHLACVTEQCALASLLISIPSGLCVRFSVSARGLPGVVDLFRP